MSLLFQGLFGACWLCLLFQGLFGACWLCLLFQGLGGACCLCLLFQGLGGVCCFLLLFLLLIPEPFSFCSLLRGFCSPPCSPCPRSRALTLKSSYLIERVPPFIILHPLRFIPLILWFGWHFLHSLPFSAKATLFFGQRLPFFQRLPC